MFIRTNEPDPTLDDFRQEVRAFCAEALPSETKARQALGQHVERDEHGAWLQQLGNRGWLTGKWPKEHGGLAWEPEQYAIFSEELGRADAPPIVPFGVTMVGPVIYTFGTQAQKDKYLPAIAKHEAWWCQGYSEPGAGSDLANLQTRAVRDGDHYVVNGQKIWTSYAHWADMMFCLVRTDPDVKKQEGISFVLIDMKTPGITVRPIIGITKGHHLNEVFFEDVRIPVENLIGEEGKGWTYAKFLLGNERVGVADIGKFEGYLRSLRQLLADTKEGGVPLANEPEFQQKVAELEVSLETVKALMADQLAAAKQDGSPSLMGAAALKVRGSEYQQAALQAIMDVLGRSGMSYQTDALHPGWNGDNVGPDEMAGLIYEHLYRRAATIYGGSTEVQKNVIAKGALGL
ncbi:MAG: alkylation response protein AidB-like acyl-CoA dehydrogenase [Gammaproteobacteria bacterium]|jgi:alkylation response protein AidB-like acyl-CoA dehydrogenase